MLDIYIYIYIYVNLSSLSSLCATPSIASHCTFIRTDSDSFSLLTILMATFWPVIQWIPSLTSPERWNEREKKYMSQTHMGDKKKKKTGTVLTVHNVLVLISGTVCNTHLSVPSPESFPVDRAQHIELTDLETVPYSYCSYTQLLLLTALWLLQLLWYCTAYTEATVEYKTMLNLEGLPFKSVVTLLTLKSLNEHVKKKRTSETAADIQHLGGRFSSKPS